MEEMDNFDRLIKEKLDGKESFISDKVWDNIQASLPKEKNRSLGRLIFALSALCLLTAATLYFYLNTKDSEGKGQSRIADIHTSSISNESIHGNLSVKDESSIKPGNHISDKNNSYKQSALGVNSNEASNNSTNTKDEVDNKGRSLKNRTNNLNSGSSNELSNNVKNNVGMDSQNEGNSIARSKSGMGLISENKTSIAKTSKPVSGKSKQYTPSKDNWQVASNKNNKGDNRSLSNSNDRIGEANNKLTEINNGQEGTFENKSEISSRSGSSKDDKPGYSSNVTSSGNESNTTSENNEGKINTSSDKNKIVASNETIKENQNSGKDISGSVQVSGKDNSMKDNEGNKEINGNQISSVSDQGKQPTTILAKKPEEKIKDSLVKKSNQENQPVEDNDVKKKKSAKEFSFPLVNIDVFLTPTYSHSRLSSNVSNIDDMKNNEKAKFSAGAGARISVNITEKIRAGLGVQYSSYGDRNKINSTKEKELFYVNYNIYQGPNGAWVYQPIDTVKFMKSFSSKKVTVNSYKYISIPVFAGYQVLDKRIGLTITGGISANILAHGQTNTLAFTSDTTLTVNTESSNRSNSPFRKLVFSTFISPGLTYKVNDKIKILFDPGVTWFLSSIYKPDYAINRRIFAVECRVGVQFTIGNK